MNTTIFGKAIDDLFMQEAYLEAERAFALGEVPVGAIVVDAYGAIVARSHNRVEQLHSQAGHAEIEALSCAGKKLKNWRLNHCWLYVTLEPCSMCMGMIRLSRLKGIAYGANSPSLESKLDNNPHSPVYQNDMLIIGGLHTEKISSLLRCFFKQQRVQGGQT
ncbi:MAG TPA: nucleoside deaminase [Patescibacteria group bacterium]|jgi:tRNA(adenine34) deaminase|nr:nucleoside deaminase [Patescibacteria group bacterium]